PRASGERQEREECDGDTNGCRSKHQCSSTNVNRLCAAEVGMSVRGTSCTSELASRRYFAASSHVACAISCASAPSAVLIASERCAGSAPVARCVTRDSRLVARCAPPSSRACQLATSSTSPCASGSKRRSSTSICQSGRSLEYHG